MCGPSGAFGTVADATAAELSARAFEVERWSGGALTGGAFDAAVLCADARNPASGVFCAPEEGKNKAKETNTVWGAHTHVPLVAAS